MLYYNINNKNNQKEALLNRASLAKSVTEILYSPRFQPSAQRVLPQVGRFRVAYQSYEFPQAVTYKTRIQVQLKLRLPVHQEHGK